MKINKIKVIIAIIFIMISCTKFTSINALASSNSKDGINVTVETDKNDYKINEKAKVSISITNTNNIDINNVSLDAVLPDDFKIDEKNSKKEIGTIKAGQNVKIEVELTFVGQSKEDINKQSPKTGESCEIYVKMIIIALISGTVIILSRKSKKFKRLLSVILIITIVGSCMPANGIVARANENENSDKRDDLRTISLENKINVDSKQQVITINVSYSSVKYNDGIISFNTESLKYNEENNEYILNDKLERLTGTLVNSDKYDVIEFSVTDIKGNVITSGTIDAVSDWSIEKIGLIYGKNNVLVTAKGSAGDVSNRIAINDAVDLNMEYLPNGTTDSDGDGLIDYYENILGTDKLKADTDGDGLTDYQEVIDVMTDPLKIDTDNDGISDYDEDYDNDTLSNGYEYTIGTSPSDEDTDYDYINDNIEINDYKTNPNNKDTDQDGGDDNWEIENGYDPLVYNDSFIVKYETGPVSSNNPTAVSVSLELKSGEVDSLDVGKVNSSEEYYLSPMIPGYLDNAYSFKVDGTFETAQMTFSYDKSLGNLSDEFQPRIYYFNEDTKMLEKLENQSVEEGKISANVSHFSKYILLNSIVFDKVWEQDFKIPSGDEKQKEGIDVVFAIDSSGSMWDNDYKGLRLDAAKSFVDKLGENDRAAVVDFDHIAQLNQEFTSDHTLLYTAINQINSDGGTDISEGMKLSLQQFTSPDGQRADVYKYIILLTDGESSYDNKYTELAKKMELLYIPLV